MSLQDLLTRVLTPSPNRGFRGVGGGAAHLGTDIGLKREENQDRVAIVRWESVGPTTMGASCAVVVSDGMGGMQDGALCATLSVATFIAELIAAPALDLTKTVKEAVELANEAVFRLYRGRGGATLSAVIMNSNGNVVGVNVGDSRIYSASAFSSSKFVSRLTVDDTLSDAYGSDNKDLLQFIGLGQGIRPNVFAISHDDNMLAITTDGAHFFDEKVFSEILQRSPDPKAIAERVIALSRWLGAPDNATIATVDVGKMRNFIQEDMLSGAELWIGGGDGPIYIVHQQRDERSTSDPVQSVKAQPVRQSVSPDPSVPKRKKRSNVKKAPSPDQLTIDVEVSSGGNADADR